MSQVKATQAASDVVQITRVWDITDAEDWVPRFKTRKIRPQSLAARWVDGKLIKVGVWGPYVLKGGALATSKHGPNDFTHFGHTGVSIEHGGIVETALSYVSLGADGQPDQYTRADYPAWVWDIVLTDGPVL